MPVVPSAKITMRIPKLRSAAFVNKPSDPKAKASPNDEECSQDPA
jgi:hypothetical protein